MKRNVIDWIAYILLIIGGLNWLLVGLFRFDIVGAIFGASILARLIYILIGLSAIYLIYLIVKKRVTI